MLKHKIPWIVPTVLFFTLLPGHSFATQDIAIVFQVKGTAKIKRAASKKSQSLKKGVHIDSGDMITTGDDGSVALIFADDKSLLRIRPNTEAVIQGEKEAKSISKRINMEIGSLWVNVKKGKGEFKVATPTTVACVKGTEFWVLVNKLGDTDVICLTGLVEVFNSVSNRSVNVPKGYTARSAHTGELPIAKTESDDIPKSIGIDEKEIEIEFEDEHGNKKTLEIRFD